MGNQCCCKDNQPEVGNAMKTPAVKEKEPDSYPANAVNISYNYNGKGNLSVYLQ